MHPLLLRLVIALTCLSATGIGGVLISPDEARADGLLGNLTPPPPTAETAPPPPPVAELAGSATQVLDAVQPLPAAQTTPPPPASPPPPAPQPSSAAPAPLTG